MMYCGMLPAEILELQDVSLFVEGFLGPELWSPNCTMERAVSLQEGSRVETLSESLLVSAISLSISFKNSTYCLSISSAVNFCLFPPLLRPDGCYFLPHLPSIAWSWLIFSPSNCSACPFQFALGQWMKLQLTLCLRNISNRSFTLQIVVQKINDIIRPFSFYRSPTSWYFFFRLTFFFYATDS